MDKKRVFPLAICSLILVFLLVTSFNMGLLSSLHTINTIFSIFPKTSELNQTKPYFIENKFDSETSEKPKESLPRLAYLISGSKDDMEKLWRALRALYHPWNVYAVHLDLESSTEERLELEVRIEKDPMYSKIGNVHMITKANMVTYRGPTMVANTLHAASILLKKSKDWDWFINLSASDYPLVTQDDIIFTFSKLNRDLNFMEHTSNLDWKEEARAKPVIIDPGLYKLTKSDVFWASEKRGLPTSFKLFTGSAWMVLSRQFVTFCIWGWDNLPRAVLMYYTNFLSSPEGYFQTVICNVPMFVSTTINHDLHYISWDTPPKQHPHTLSLNDTDALITSDAPFARKFGKDDPVLEMIDKQLLGRPAGNFTPGGWCSGTPPCSEVGNPSNLKPGAGSGRLARLMAKLLLSPMIAQQQCQ